MSNIPNKPDYDHGSTGTEPNNPIDYNNGDSLDANNLDYFIYTPLSKIKSIIDYLNLVDSDGDGVVDEADTATDADNVTGTYKGNDIDSDGDGRVNAADTATDADNVTGTYKGNDIDSDGDGVVNEANDSQQYDGTAPSDGSSGQYLKTDGTTTSWDNPSRGSFGRVQGFAYPWVHVNTGDGRPYDASGNLVIYVNDFLSEVYVGTDNTSVARDIYIDYADGTTDTYDMKDQTFEWISVDTSKLVAVISTPDDSTGEVRGINYYRT